MNEERPLIWTTKGNLPVDELQHEAEWDVQEGYIKFSERYRTADGEVVKESAHVYSKFGVTGEAVSASLA
jgi:hypothetical protein